MFRALLFWSCFSFIDFFSLILFSLSMSVSISSVFGWFGGLLLRGQQTFLCWSPGRKPRNLFFSRLFCALLGSLYLFVLVLPLWFFLLPISLCFRSPSLFFFLSYFFVCFCHVFFCLSFCLCSLRMWPFSGFYRAKECPLFCSSLG